MVCHMQNLPYMSSFKNLSLWSPKMLDMYLDDARIWIFSIIDFFFLTGFPPPPPHIQPQMLTA